MSDFQLFLRDEAHTLAFGELLALAMCTNGSFTIKSEYLTNPEDVKILGGVIYLNGGLGAGKTTLTRGVMRGFGYEGAVKSPTYTIIETYEFQKSQIYHFDLYRLAHAEEVEYLGAENYFLSENLCLIEWAEKGKGSIPSPDLVVNLSEQGEGRLIHCQDHSDKGLKIIQRIREKGRNL